MASVIPFNNATINGVSVTTAEILHGSCNYVKNGQDVATTTADGRIHNDRTVVTKDITFECYGDKTSLESTVGLGTTVVLKYDSTTVDTVTGIVTASYDSNTKTTQIKVYVDPA